MPNKTYALEWLEYSKRNIQAAQILFRENHYTDVIAVELHQGVEPSHDENFDTVLLSMSKCTRIIIWRALPLKKRDKLSDRLNQIINR